MDPKPQRPKRQDNVLSLLNAIIEVTNLAKEISSPTPAKAVFGSVGVILTTIKVRSPLLRRYTPGSDVTRTQWPTNLTVSSSG